ncbi:MAG TPA: phenylalanine--tRNA ligase subunit alpha [Candidatus Saccharicenans sp.]|nr:phenylalanine--tRNA ligase subunit alpha [Candidatus Saccharicenans sp.]HRD02872.1 phenylalanine--tRNA ligase subunit alpha [Candidatus Saccharicenans sp.]
MQEKIEQYRQLFNDLAAKTKNIKELEELKQAFLSRKKGYITLLFDELKQLSPEEKKSAGVVLNDFKMEVQQTLTELEQKCLKPKAEKISPDLTLPGRKIYWGAPHPITLFQRKIEKIFISMGFAVEEGPEIETDYYNFEALNFPPYHPARDSWDTLYINDRLLLRTHTSPVQIRVMEKKKPPIRIIIPGKVYRRETPDPTHLPMFHQVEGLVVDRGITFAHLKGTLEYFIRALFGEKIKIRFRPSFFPFTEPSAEVDIECIACHGQDAQCRVCGGTGWKEILGAGLVDPQVFKNVNIDPEKYSGWAFGLGIDRTAMLAYEIPEMRYFYENDLRFLRQFNRR